MKFRLTFADNYKNQLKINLNIFRKLIIYYIKLTSLTFIQNKFNNSANSYEILKTSITNYLKKKKKLYTILKSPHIYKKSKEHFIEELFYQNLNFSYYLNRPNNIISYKQTILIKLIIQNSNMLLKMNSKLNTKNEYIKRIYI